MLIIFAESFGFKCYDLLLIISEKTELTGTLTPDQIAAESNDFKGIVHTQILRIGALLLEEIMFNDQDISSKAIV